MHKLCKGKVPPCTLILLMIQIKHLLAEMIKAKARSKILMESYKFRDALFEVIDLAQKGQ